MDKCSGVAKSLHCSTEAIITLLTGYTPIRNVFGVMKWITNKDLLYSTRDLFNVIRQPGWEGSRGENGYVCILMAESFCCSAETITTLFIDYTPK